AHHRGPHLPEDGLSPWSYLQITQDTASTYPYHFASHQHFQSTQIHFLNKPRISYYKAHVTKESNPSITVKQILREHFDLT
ncbi:hypothetical protein VEx25_A1445, partial [Vibrio antiquarius]